MTTAPAFDQAKAEAFAGSVLGTINGALVTLMISVAHRTGLFDRMSALSPSTSSEIADAAGLNERYVRECLGALTLAGIVEYDPAAKTYRLPAEHAAFLTRAAGPNNLSTFAQFVPLMASVEDKIIESFQQGGGVPYSEFKTFHALMAEESAQVFDATLVDVTLPLTGIVDRLKDGIDVLDVGCGRGHAINLMAKAFPNSRFVGYDFSDDAIAHARGEADSMGLANARFEVQDAAKFEAYEAFDLITAFDSIHDQAAPTAVLANIARALRPGSVFLMVDIAASSNLEENAEHPLGAGLFAISTMHCMTVSLALGGEGLGTVWGQQLAMKKLEEAGFTEVDIKSVEGDILNAYYIARKA